MAKLIAPSILSADFANLETEIKTVESAGADWLHVDVMDGHFVNNITIGIPVVRSLKKVAKVPLDVHLMIEKPEKYAAEFVMAGADWLTIHVESTKDPGYVLQEIRKMGAHPGITLRPGTPVKDLKPYLQLVDLVLVMTVEPGFGGQDFMKDQVAKIEELVAWRTEHGHRYLIEVDGGVNDRSLPYLAHADVLVAGSYVFKKESHERAGETHLVQKYKTAIESLRKS